MKVFKNHSYLPYVLLIVMSSISYTLVSAKPERQRKAVQTAVSQAPQVTAQPDKDLQQAHLTLAKTSGILVQLDHVIEYIAMLINNTAVPNIKSSSDKRKATEAFLEMRKQLNSMGREIAVLASVQDVPTLHQINSSLIIYAQAVSNHMYHILKNKFANVTAFNPAILIKRTKHAVLDAHACEHNTTMLGKKIEALHTMADNVNLTRLNHAARFLDRTIVSPWQRWNMGRYVKLGALTGFVGTIALWQFGALYKRSEVERNWKVYTDGPQYREDVSKIALDASIKDPELAKTVAMQQFIETQHAIIRNKTKVPFFDKFFSLFSFLGYPYPESRQGVIDKEELHNNSDKYTNFGRFMYTVDSYLWNNMPTLALAGAYLYSQYQDIWHGNKENKTSGLGKTIKDSMQMLWNKARGGAYLQTKIAGNWEFEPKITFDDVVGLDQAKMVLAEVVQFILNTEQQTQLKLAPELGYLLTGQTRTGKTYIFEALCGEIVKQLEAQGRSGHEFKFKIIPAQDILQVGIDTILEWARYEGPMVLFIDEIDLLNLYRAGGNTTVLAQFLTALGNTFNKDPKKPVIVIGATNQPETLDRALRQHGRLGKEIRFERPSSSLRKEYIAKEFYKMAVDTSELDLDAIVEKTHGKSYEDLHTAVSAALRLSWMLSVPLSQEIIEHCINSELRGIIDFDSKKLPNSEIDTLSTHFAGRALAALLLNRTDRTIDLVTIKPIMNDLKDETHFDTFMKEKSDDKQQEKIVHGGIFMRHLQDSINIMSHEQLVHDMKMLLAGFAAEEIIFGHPSYMYHAQDRSIALKIAKKVVFKGLDEKELAKETLQSLTKQAYDLLVNTEQDVKAMLSEHTEALKQLSAALKQMKLLDGRMIQFIVDVAEKRIDITQLQQQMQQAMEKEATQSTLFTPA